MRRNFNPSETKWLYSVPFLCSAFLGGEGVSTWSRSHMTGGKVLHRLLWFEGAKEKDVKIQEHFFFPSFPLPARFLASLLSVQTLPVLSTVQQPGRYDTQQQVLVFGCSSSIGCFSLRRGGSPLAGV